MLLGNYLKDYNVEVAGLLEKVNYSQSQLTNLTVINYPDSLIRLISERVHRSESSVWYELLKLENKQAVTKISNTEDLIEAVEERQAYIYIPEPVRSKQQRLVNSVLTEEDRLGFELGSRGTGNILAEIIYQLGMLLNKESRDFKRIKSKLRHYYVKVHDEHGSLLYEKEQTY